VRPPGRVFCLGEKRTAGPSTAPSLSLRLARDDNHFMGRCRSGLLDCIKVRRNGGFMEELREKKNPVFGDEAYQELQEARGVGGVGVCGAGYWAGVGAGAALGRVVGV